MLTQRIVTRTIDSPVGPLLAGVADPVNSHERPRLCLLEFTTRPRLNQEKHDLERLLSCQLEEQGEFETATPATELLDETERQLAEYFASERTAFDLPLLLPGTPFQEKVWHALTEIPFGTTISYDTLAKRVGSVARAVGGANGANRVPIVVPCHRVIGADGSLTGFGGGMHNKRLLLEHEHALTPELFA
ncbi:MAG: methylated-DNA--[protein]-cysteine S-methyltransferase [Phycisphaerales bacterium]|nr:methylated-DNA--[protein]-cysteine S-methyltransferase [Phycisphaerales bacterium]MCB9835298.1 methylated-DNA--[protein]-cysteine S-methyltransferase [Phycisphaera sp.]